MSFAAHYPPEGKIAVGGVVEVQDSKGRPWALGRISGVRFTERYWVVFAAARTQCAGEDQPLEPIQHFFELAVPIEWVELTLVETIRYLLHFPFADTILDDFLSTRKEQLDYQGALPGDPDWISASECINAARINAAVRQTFDNLPRGPLPFLSD